MVKSVSASLWLGFLCSCANATGAVKKEDWVRCWEACGKKDNLRSVGGAYCRCEDGRKILRDEEPTQSVFEIMGMAP